MSLSPRQQLQEAISVDGRTKWWLDPARNKAFARPRKHLGVIVEFFGSDPEKPWRIRIDRVVYVATAQDAIEQINNYLKKTATQ